MHDSTMLPSPKRQCNAYKPSVTAVLTAPPKYLNTVLKKQNVTTARRLSAHNS
jgi:hypothetical protein